MKAIALITIVLAAGIATPVRQTAGEEEIPRTPTITSDWFRIVEYPGHHLNDFCLFRDKGGVWHAIGILGTGTWASEVTLFHSSGTSLHEPFVNHSPIFRGMPKWISEKTSKNTAPQKHAPFVVFHEGVYHMFYRRPNGTNLRVRTQDPMCWPNEVEFVFEKNDARDACIQKFDGVYHWYYCQYHKVNGKGRSCIMLRRSKDLERWSNPITVHVDTSREVKHTMLESPFVVHAADHYWLFIRNRSMEERCVTTVFKSDLADRFASGVRCWDTELTGVHAPELVEANGTWYIARVSGPPDHLPSAPKKDGWIEIAEISFDTSTPADQ